jgi:carbamoyltransferase
MEYGPRALGNRSIICSAKDKSINETLNDKLKRSDFMPFAPCVLREDFNNFFETNLQPDDFEYMTFTCKTKNTCNNLTPAIVHIDKTARPQTVSENTNHFLYNILKEYKKKTGVGLLINTSFNVHEEPIVESTLDAIKSFELSKLDFLILENIVIKSGK